MTNFKITFTNELEAENEEAVIEWLFEYLIDCVREDNIRAFKIFEIKDNEK